MSKINFIGSYEHSECGLACVAMMIDFFAQEASLPLLRETYGVPMGGFNVSQMIEILYEFNVPAKAMKVNDIKKLTEIEEPFIAHWNTNHFVVVEKFENKKVVIVDPAKGKLRISIKEFENSFSNAIICSIIVEKKKKRNGKLIRFY